MHGDNRVNIKDGCFCKSNIGALIIIISDGDNQTTLTIFASIQLNMWSKNRHSEDAELNPGRSSCPNKVCMILTGMGDVGRAGEDGIGTRQPDHTGVEPDMICCME